MWKNTCAKYCRPDKWEESGTKQTDQIRPNIETGDLNDMIAWDTWMLVIPYGICSQILYWVSVVLRLHSTKNKMGKAVI